MNQVDGSTEPAASTGYPDKPNEEQYATMTTNSLKTKIGAGGTVFGGWCTLSDSLIAEMVGGLDVDYVVVDMQHGVAAYSDLIAMLQGIDLTDATPLVRIPHGDFGLAQRVLDAGAQGIIVPLVDSAVDAAQAAQACRYPPIGGRSFGPIRSQMHLGVDSEHVNEEVLCLVQIETPAAMQNLEEIVATPGVDGVYVGPADLALTHGLLVGREDPALQALLTTVVQACRAAGVIAGVHAFSGTSARHASEMGFSMITVGSDATWLRAGYSRELSTARGTTPEGTRELY